MTESAAENEIGGTEAGDETLDAHGDPTVTSTDGEPAEGGSTDAESASSAADGDSGQTEVVALREEFESLNDRHLRLVAEFNNFKRRSEQERLAVWGRAQADMVGKLVDVLDDLQRVAELDMSNATVEAIMEGIDLVERKFVRSLSDVGVETILPDGVPFDPEVMEAMMRVPAESDEQMDQVAQVFQKGYALKGQLIRPARVSVFTQS